MAVKITAARPKIVLVLADEMGFDEACTHAAPAAPSQ